MTTLLTLAVGLVFGFLAQRSRFCMVAPIRNWLLTHDLRAWEGVLALFVTTYFGYSLAQYFGVVERSVPLLGLHLTTTAILIASAAFGLGFLSMLVGNCPARQHVAAAEGDADATYYLFGFYIGVVAFHVLTSRVFTMIAG